MNCNWGGNLENLSCHQIQVKRTHQRMQNSEYFDGDNDSEDDDYKDYWADDPDVMEYLRHEEQIMLRTVATSARGINWQALDGRGFLHIHCRSLYLVKRICELGVDVNMLDGRRTGLSCAIEYGEERVVRYLLEVAKCNVNVRNCRGNTPLDHALMSKQWPTAERIVLRLLKHGAVRGYAAGEDLPLEKMFNMNSFGIYKACSTIVQMCCMVQARRRNGQAWLNPDLIRQLKLYLY